MQPREINNFRCRAKSCGYRQIKIKCLNRQDKNGNLLYVVNAIEPISGEHIQAVLTVGQFTSLCWYGKKSQRAFERHNVD